MADASLEQLEYIGTLLIELSNTRFRDEAKKISRRMHKRISNEEAGQIIGRLKQRIEIAKVQGRPSKRQMRQNAKVVFIRE